MPRPKGSGKGQTGRFNVRLDEDTAAFYRTKANEAGISMSEFLRQTLVQGIIAENALEFESRLKDIVAELRTNGSGNVQALILEEMQMSQYTCEALLTAIVEARDIQQLYQAQDKAKARIKKYKAAHHDQTGRQEQHG